MKYAFVHKNFRALDFEQKTIFLCHVVTMAACFTPWLSTSISGEDGFFNAFMGPTFLMGWVVFIISFVIFLLFLDRLLDRRKIKLGFPETYLYACGGALQILLLLLIWSVLASSGCGFDSEVRFGLFLALIAQIAGLVATFINYQQEQQHEAQSFFQYPDRDSQDHQE
ncbi:MAG TPA: hypothetical protein VIT68_05120 [Candidatus Gracilibacteria bacterium]